MKETVHQLRLKRIELKEYCISKEIFNHLCQTFLYRLALEQDYTGRKIKIGGSQQSILNTQFPCCFFFSKNFSPRDLQDSPFISDLCWNLRFSWLSCSKQLATHSVGDQQLGVCCLILSKPPYWFLAGHTARLSLKLDVTICYWDLSNGMWVKCAKLPCTLLPFSPFKASFSHVDEENILWLHNNERKEPNSLHDLVYHNCTSKQDPFLQRPDMLSLMLSGTNDDSHYSILSLWCENHSHQTNGGGCFPIKLYLQKEAAGQTWPMAKLDNPYPKI